jgi:hypothetical protein
LHQNSFNLILSNENGLQFYSHFDYQSADDVIYHFVFTLQQKQLLDQAGALIISSSVGASENVANEIQDKLKTLNELKDFKIDINSQLLLNNQTLCV